MATTVLLIILGALWRLVPHAPNLVGIGALGLYSGARLSRRWAFVVPVGAMMVSDLVLDLRLGESPSWFERLTIYATFAGIVALGRLPRPDAGPLVRVAMSLVASSVFFITSNLAVWIASGIYPRTGEGLVLCFIAALPFFGGTVVGDLTGTAIFFSLDALAARVRQRRMRAVVASAQPAPQA